MIQGAMCEGLAIVQKDITRVALIVLQSIANRGKKGREEGVQQSWETNSASFVVVVVILYLDQGKAEDWGSDVTDPHTGDSSNEHVGEQDSAGASPGSGEDHGSHGLGNVEFAHGGSDSKSTKQQHDHGREHE